MPGGHRPTVRTSECPIRSEASPVSPRIERTDSLALRGQLQGVEAQAMLEAALQDYPQPMRRRVVVELPAPTGGNR